MKQFILASLLLISTQPLFAGITGLVRAPHILPGLTPEMLELKKPLPLGSPVPSVEEMNAARTTDGFNYGAIAYSLSRGIVIGSKQLESPKGAIRDALLRCNKESGADDCVLAVAAGGPNTCIAVASDGGANFGSGNYSAEVRSDIQNVLRNAERFAQADCGRKTNPATCRIQKSICTKTFNL